MLQCKLNSFHAIQITSFATLLHRQIIAITRKMHNLWAVAVVAGLKWAITQNYSHFLCWVKSHHSSLSTFNLLLIAINPVQMEQTHTIRRQQSNQDLIAESNFSLTSRVSIDPLRWHACMSWVKLPNKKRAFIWTRVRYRERKVGEFEKLGMSTRWDEGSFHISRRRIAVKDESEDPRCSIGNCLTPWNWVLWSSEFLLVFFLLRTVIVSLTVVTRFPNPNIIDDDTQHAVNKPRNQTVNNLIGWGGEVGNCVEKLFPLLIHFLVELNQQEQSGNHAVWDWMSRGVMCVVGAATRWEKPQRNESRCLNSIQTLRELINFIDLNFDCILEVFEPLQVVKIQKTLEISAVTQFLPTSTASSAQLTNFKFHVHPCNGWWTF